MSKIREYTTNPLVVGIAAFVIGAIFGLVVLGWLVWPVQWTNATPAELSQDWQEEYLRMSIQAYGATGDIEAATMHYDALGEDAEETMALVMQDPQGLSPELINAFHIAVGAGAAPPAAVATAVPGAELTPTVPGAELTPGLPAAVVTPTTAPEAKKGRSMWVFLIPLFCLVFLVLIATLVYLLVFRGKKPAKGAPPTPAQQAEEAKRQAAYTDFEATGVATPIAQFMASYKVGDDLFDDSFSIDSASGEFLGECGVGISETIGVGDTKKVTAFEAWLFDKNDIQTVTKVIMSAHAFNDAAIRQRLQAKGEPVLAEPGMEAVLETQTLTLSVRVVDMGYGNGSMPSQSFFDHLILELAIWQK